MSFKARLFWSASFLIVGGAAAPALAQDQSQEDVPVAPSGAVTAADDPGTAADEEIIVTGVRASIIEGLQNKREATQIIESVVAEDIGKLPDNNVVDALQRVPGIQVTGRTGGEANAISIRGLPDITTTWNGRAIFTASGRQFALQDIPANLVSRIDVYKTRAAEQIETGIAGQIDVFTRRPFDFKDLAFSVAARGIWHEQADKFNPNVSALISKRWETGIGDIGALVNVSYARTKYRDQSITAGAMVPFATADNPPPGFTPLQRFFDFYEPGLDRGLPYAQGSTINVNGTPYPYLLSRDALFASDFRGDRERPAVNVALQWAPNSSSEYTFEFFWDGFRNTTFNNLHFTFADWWGNLGPNPASTYELFEGTNIIKSRTVGAPFGFNSGDFTKQSTDSYVYALAGKWDLSDQFKLNADISYQTSRFKSQFLAMRTTRVPGSVSVDFNSGGGLPAWEFNDNSELLDPASWTVGEFYDTANLNKGDAFTITADADYDFSAGPFKRFSFGLRYDDRGASEAARNQDAPALNQSFSTLDPGLYWTNKGFFDGRSNVPDSWLVANGYYLIGHADEVRQLYRNSVDPGIQLSDQLALRENFDVNERTLAAYAQLDLEQEVFGRPLKVQGGVRYVYVDTDMDFTDALTLTSSSASSSLSEVLPSVTLRYDIMDNLRFRFNFGETLRRPNFTDLNPYFTLTGDLTNVGYGTGGGGNPNLGPTKARNFDLALEWYFTRDSAIYATLFRREIDGLVVPLRRQITVPNSGQNTDRFVVTQPVNASDGVLKGLELGFVFFPELPGLLQGLGAQGSFTWLKSKQNIPQTNTAGEIIGQEESDFFGVSDFSYNITGAYERGPVGLRLSWVWRKNFLNNNEARLFANPIGIWRRPEKSLDFQFTYSLNDRLAVTLDATNLTDELSQSYYRFADAGGPETHNFGSTILSRTVALGVRYSFP
ncbi:TonB-dependent receptor [Sphingosinicella sp. BN140058]|uniref:TonB-dependent receptor n=1 Tax=Sphingosinicella sp. BN140058 TaxID=1892855 RepID=UPI0010115ECD|nr:TonB-dependent receptor [Sphingosinicella sp. BN140058]QAY75439.1 TonB-dependent receptor [Sphingosinicella sp. BN140058]